MGGVLGRLACVYLSVSLACGGGVPGGESSASSRHATALENAPPTADTTAAVETHGNYANPPSNTGAFLYQIPIDVPAGIGGLTPQVALGYSSTGGLGALGVGWDLPVSAITLNQAEGVRPVTIEADIMRFAPDVPVKRYGSNFGTMAVSRSGESYFSAKTYLFDPHFDASIRPVSDATGTLEYTGEKAAWQVTTRDGTSYRYGYTADASLWDNDTLANARKVAWFLDRVEDRHGNQMKFYYEEYPEFQDRYRQPVLRAIEYGIPASNQNTPARIVVQFEYIESPWKRFSYNLETRTDYAFLLDEVCVYAKTAVESSTTPLGRQQWSVPNAGTLGSTDSWTNTSCWELTYDFEDAAAYPAAYTSRPLLMKVQQRAHDGAMRPPWTFAYTHSGVDWSETYRASLASGGTEWDAPADTFLEVSTHDVTQQYVDVDGDGVADVLRGTADGAFDVDLTRRAADGTVSHPNESWPNPLASAAPMNLVATAVEANKDGPDSNCWYDFTANVRWRGSGTGLGYARTMTRAPDPFDSMYYPTVPLVDDNWDEQEAEHTDLGAFQFLHASYYAPYPAFGKRNLVDRADTFDQLETFGSYKDKRDNEYAFSYLTTDCQDWLDRVELDMCWNVAAAGSEGALGADLQCLDHAGGRWMAEAGVANGNERGYSTELWSLQDLDGDGFADWVFAAPAITRDASGVVRDYALGANDWYWSPGNGVGWDSPRPWVVPASSGGSMPPGVDKVHATGMLGVAVSDTDIRANRVWGAGVNLSAGATGFAVGASVITPGGAVTIPVYGVGFGPALGSGIGVGPAGTAGIAAMGQLAALGNNRAVGAAAQSLRAVASSGDLRAALPSVGVGFSVTNKGAILSLDLPLFGDVVVKFKNDPAVSRSFGYQGMIDVTGDGRADLVSTRYSALGSVNPGAFWMVYPNEGAQFGTPRLMPFAATPPESLLGKTETSNQVDVVWLAPPDLTLSVPFGTSEQTYGMVDVNGDGLLDLVNATNQTREGTLAHVHENGWTVYFNQGHIFSEPIWWPFAGDWQTQHGRCGVVRAQPRVSRTVYGQYNHNTIGQTNGDRILVGARQVQGMLDLNGDGLLDYWYEKPAPVDGDEDVCDYVTPDSRFSNLDEIRERVHPSLLHRELLVRLSTGAGFARPQTWIDDDGMALAGGIVDYTNVGPASKQNFGVVGVGDFDGDGALDLGKRFDDSRFDNVPFGSFHSTLFKLGESGVDMMSSVTLPGGGTIAVGYDFQAADRHQAGGQWVASSIRIHDDLDPNALDVTRHYYYEGGRYDRANRRFQGFERVYQVADGGDGYTLSRYYQTPGLEGQLYCREVRRRDDAGLAVEALVLARRDAWIATPPGQARAGYVPPVAIGDAAHATALAGPQSLPGDTADPGEGEGGEGAYGAPPAPGADDQTADEAEGESYAEDSEPDPPHADWPSTADSDAAGVLTTPPIDSTLPGFDVPWQFAGDTPDTIWWDSPVQSDDCVPGVTDTTSFACDPADVKLAQLACGDVTDPGVAVQQEFAVLADRSTVIGIHTPRLVASARFLYDAVGGNPQITATQLTYDERGNVIETIDIGDIAVPSDDLVTTTRFAPPHMTWHVIDKPCTIKVEDRTGAILASTDFLYDGATSSACNAVAVGDLTSRRRSVAAGSNVRDDFAYTPEGLVSDHKDPRGLLTKRFYSAAFPWFETAAAQVVASLMGPLTLRTERKYLGVNKLSLDNFGVVGEVIGANGDRTTTTYDLFDRVVKVVRPYDSMAAPTEHFTYHDRSGAPGDRAYISRVQRRDFASEVPTTTTFDGFGLVHQVFAVPPDNLENCPRGACSVIASEQTYDADGRVVTLRHPYFDNHAEDAVDTVTTYDLLGRLTGVTGPNLAETTTRYDRDLVTVIEPDGGVVVTRVDARNNPLEVFRYNRGGAAAYSGTRHEYRPDGKRIRTIDDAGNTWEFAYDRLGRQTSVSDPNTGVKSTIFDANDNPVLVTDERYATLGMATAWVYDALDRPIVRETRAGTTVTGTTLSGGTVLERALYVYDVDPALIPGAQLACPDDHLGRPTRVSQARREGAALSTGSIKEYCYDKRGRVTDLAHTIDGETYKFHYTYGSADQILTTTYPDADIVTNTYDASGRLARMRNTTGDLIASSKANASGLPVKRVLGTGRLEQRWCYAPGPSGLLQARTVAGAGAMDFECDADPSVPVAGAFYDVSYTHSAGGRIATRHEALVRPTTGLETHDTSYGYDDVLRLQTETYDGASTDFGFDRLDNLTSKDGVVQTYGTSGRAVRNAGPNALLAGVGARSFTYDRVGNVLSFTSGGALWGLVRGFDGQPQVVTQGAAVVARYFYDETGQRVFRDKGGLQTRYAGDFRDGASQESHYPGVGIKVGTEQYYTFGDGAGSTAMMTDAAGNVVQTISYDPFGAIRSNATYDPDPADGLAPFQTVDQFNGKERDTAFHTDDDILDFGPRMYFADVGVWMSPDPTFEDGINRYAFVNGDPVNSRDPTGEGGVPLLLTALMACSPPSETLTGRPTNEIVFVFVRHGSGFVYHAGAWIPNAGDPVLVDFGGSYGSEAWNDSTDVMFGEKADLEEYLTYERKDGDALDLALVGTSPADQKAIVDRISSWSPVPHDRAKGIDPVVDRAPGQCAAELGRGVNGIGPYSIDERTMRPQALHNQIRSNETSSPLLIPDPEYTGDELPWTPKPEISKDRRTPY